MIPGPNASIREISDNIKFDKSGLSYIFFFLRDCIHDQIEVPIRARPRLSVQADALLPGPAQNSYQEAGSRFSVSVSRLSFTLLRSSPPEVVEDTGSSCSSPNPDAADLLGFHLHLLSYKELTSGGTSEQNTSSQSRRCEFAERETGA